MKRLYIEKKFNARHVEIIDTADAILREYEQQGLKMTLRQLYYQFVARDLLENRDANYKMLGNVIKHARDAGRISWRQLEDPTRLPDASYLNEDASEVVAGLSAFMSYDYWQRQNVYVEVWVEKQALFSIVDRAAKKFKATTLACKGYMSATAAWEAGQRFGSHMNGGADVHLIHLGDHDPSGCHMTEDNRSRLERYDAMGVNVHRIGLNMEQIEEFNPPPNAAKLTDPRAAEYIKKFGDTSWELDALDPAVLDRLVTSNLQNLIGDQSVWDATISEECEAKAEFDALPDNWDDIREFLAHREWLMACLEHSEEIETAFNLDDM